MLVVEFEGQTDNVMQEFGIDQHVEADRQFFSFAADQRAADFIVDTSHGLDPVRARIRDILDEIAKMPKRRA